MDIFALDFFIYFACLCYRSCVRTYEQLHTFFALSLQRLALRFGRYVRGAAGRPQTRVLRRAGKETCYFISATSSNIPLPHRHPPLPLIVSGRLLKPQNRSIENKDRNPLTEPHRPYACRDHDAAASISIVQFMYFS